MKWKLTSVRKHWFILRISINIFILRTSTRSVCWIVLYWYTTFEHSVRSKMIMCGEKNLQKTWNLKRIFCFFSSSNSVFTGYFWLKNRNCHWNSSKTWELISQIHSFYYQLKSMNLSDLIRSACKWLRKIYPTYMKLLYKHTYSTLIAYTSCMCNVHLCLLFHERKTKLTKKERSNISKINLYSSFTALSDFRE